MCSSVHKDDAMRCSSRTILGDHLSIVLVYDRIVELNLCLNFYLGDRAFSARAWSRSILSSSLTQ